MSTPFRFVIRDGLARDIPACLELDHTYKTEHVWQMSIFQDNYGWEIKFKTERLPRVLETTYPASARRLQLSLPRNQCFVVAVGSEIPEVLGYLTMRAEPVRGVGYIQDVVVSRPFRRRKIGARLLHIANRWAAEHELHQLIMETQTKNYPSIEFCRATGFTFCGFNDQYLENQDIAVFFGKPVDSPD